MVSNFSTGTRRDSVERSTLPSRALVVSALSTDPPTAVISSVIWSRTRARSGSVSAISPVRMTDLVATTVRFAPTVSAVARRVVASGATSTAADPAAATVRRRCGFRMTSPVPSRRRGAWCAGVTQPVGVRFHPGGGPARVFATVGR